MNLVKIATQISPVNPRLRMLLLAQHNLYHIPAVLLQSWEEGGGLIREEGGDQSNLHHPIKFGGPLLCYTSVLGSSCTQHPISKLRCRVDTHTLRIYHLRPTQWLSNDHPVTMHAKAVHHVHGDTARTPLMLQTHS